LTVHPLLLQDAKKTVSAMLVEEEEEEEGRRTEGGGVGVPVDGTVQVCFGCG
jgi:hypothetical protein